MTAGDMGVPFMNITCCKSYRLAAVSVLISLLTALPLAGSVLDFADQVVAELEQNDTPETAQNLADIFSPDVLSVGVQAALDADTDVDVFRLTVADEDRLELRFEILETSDKTITALAAGPDNLAYFVAQNGLWVADPNQPDQAAVLLASRSDLAQALDLPADAAVLIADITLIGQPQPEQDQTPLSVALALAGEADTGATNLLALDVATNNLSLLISRQQILNATNRDDASLQSIAGDIDGRLYLADQTSASVLLAQPDDQQLYALATYTTANTLQDALQTQLLTDLGTGVTPMPSTVLAQAEDPFTVNALVIGYADYAVPDRDVFYLSQLGPDFDGTGGITQISISDADPEDVEITDFFLPSEEQTDLNPSALALDTSPQGLFANKLFMGTFGPSLGDDFDGALYTVEPDATIANFVTAYVDTAGEPVLMDDTPVTGFFDVTDLAFPTTLDGPYGPYLYLLSENIDSNGSEEGGFKSDLWRVSADGVAQLFVPDIANGVIALAFDNTLAYGQALYVATFTEVDDDGNPRGPQIIRVEPDGSTSTFTDFNVFGSQLNFADIAFVPLTVDSPLAGRMITVVKAGQNTFLVEIDPSGSTDIQIWAGDLPIGDVSSGDMVFDDDANLILALQETQQIARLDYQTVFEYSFNDLQIRPETETVEPEDPQQDPTEITTYTPYISLSLAGQPRILRLSDSGDPDDIRTEAGPQLLDTGTVPDDGSKQIAYTFDDQGDLLLSIQNAGQISRSERSELNAFDSLSPLLDTDDIDDATDLVDTQISHLAWTPNGNLLARANNGTQPPQGEDPPSQTFDDVILNLGNTQSDQYSAEVLADVAELTQMSVLIEGPSGPFAFTAGASATLAQTLTGDDLATGDYTVTVSPLLDSTGDYELLLALGGELDNSIVITQATSPLSLTNADQQRLLLEYTGPGQATLELTQKPSGAVVQTTRITLAGSTARSSLRFVNLDDPARPTLDELVLAGSLKQLHCTGSIQTLAALEFTKGLINTANLGHVRDIQTPNYRYNAFTAQSLGDPNLAGRQCQATQLQNVHIAGNIDNMAVLQGDTTNYYRTFRVEGVIRNSVVNGRKLALLQVKNQQNEPAALDTSTFSFAGKGGFIGRTLIEQGDVLNSFFAAPARILAFEIANGNLVSSTVRVNDTRGTIVNLLVGRTDSENTDAGNIIDATVSASRTLLALHADGDISGATQISATGSFKSRLARITCGGQFSASATAWKIQDIHVGVDRQGQRLPENDDFTGSDFTGSATAYLKLQRLSATGKIRDAAIRANTQLASPRFAAIGVIDNIYAEDGLENTNIAAVKRIQTIMVGYLQGRRPHIINTDANVSGAFSVRRLGRLYYTGNRDDLNLDAVRFAPVLVDDVKDN